MPQPKITPIISPTKKYPSGLRSTWAEINIDAFRHNLGNLRAIVGPSTKIMAVVKADAYGHGAVPCAKAAMDSDADYLGVGILQEGIELRESGIISPILVMGGIFPNEVENLVKHKLSTILFSQPLAQALDKQAKKMDTTVAVHIKIDTGMGRLGVSPENFFSLAEYVLKSKNLQLEGICTHFSSADEEDFRYSLLQLTRFNEIRAKLKKKGVSPPLIHAANTAALLNFPESRFNMVRPGILLYGSLPSPTLQPVAAKRVKEKNLKNFRQVMTWKSRILQINSLPKGSPVSYGGNHVTSKNSLIATLPVGYADGLHRSLSNKMEVLVHGKRMRQVGTICMDMTLIDVTGLPNVAEGDEVVIFGAQKKGTIPIEEVAEKSDTLPYETMCNVGKRVPRIYL